ncbi:hypothetical protein JCM8547_002378 [Rhodosporidiobolus lusitaniae]
MGLFRRSTKSAASSAKTSRPSTPPPSSQPQPAIDPHAATSSSPATMPSSSSPAAASFPISFMDAPSLPPTVSLEPLGEVLPHSTPPLSASGEQDDGSESHASSEDDFEDAAEASAAAVEAAVPAEPRVSTSPVPQEKAAKEEKRELSKAARLVKEKMDEPTTARKRLGKPLSSLTAKDVAMTEAEMRQDINEVWKALHLFLSSRMTEAEAILAPASDHRLYFAVGASVIQGIKSLATFEPADLEAAIQCCREATHIANLLRKKNHGLFERANALAKGSTSVGSIQVMNVVERHAELVYAECTLLKAVLGIIYSGDFLAFLKEALNMRSAYAIYRTLAKFVEQADEASGGFDSSIDQDFRSGVLLGNGMISLILSLLPSSVLTVMSVFGFTGDRDQALSTLMKAGGWKTGVAEPSVDPAEEGLRRSVCDMVLLMFHLVISSYIPVGAVDVSTAAHILRYNLDRYPTGIFFLYFAGRLHATETKLDEATDSLRKAIDAQRDFKQLSYIALWDLGLVALAKGDWVEGNKSFGVLSEESNWSKAVYAYSKAVTLYEAGLELDKVASTMQDVPNLTQKIGGKSLPIEKFVSRRARKFVSQGNRLALPGIELAYVLNCIGMSPRVVLVYKSLEQVNGLLKQLAEVKDPARYGATGEEYCDDYCLAHFLRGVILRYIAHPEPHVVLNPEASPIPISEADEQALLSFNNVLKHGANIVHDHHLVWFTHYELGRLHQFRGEWTKARAEYELVLSGKNLEVGLKKGKGKVSLQNMAVLRSNAGLQALKEAGH